MIINLSPQQRPQSLTVSKQGDILTINDEIFDFSAIPDGATLPAEAIVSDWLVGDVERLNGEIVLTMILPLQADASEAARFPAPLLNPADGVLELPL